MNVFLDCEFSDLQALQMLSLGMITSAGREFYVELTGPGLQEALSNSTEFDATWVGARRPCSRSQRSAARSELSRRSKSAW